MRLFTERGRLSTNVGQSICLSFVESCYALLQAFGCLSPTGRWAD